MGCGSSASQTINTRENIFKIEHILGNKNQKQESIANGKIYLFGQTRTQRKIIECEVKLSVVKLISNKTRIPCPKIHQDPLELIYQQSQSIFNLATYGLSMLPPFNKMLMLYLQGSVIFLSGGRDYDSYNVKNQTFFYSVEDNKTMSQMNSANELNSRAMTRPMYSRSRFQKMANMSRKRHSHMGIYSSKLKSVLVFGGINQKDQTLSSCQIYNIVQNAWTELPSMKVPRADGHCFEYRNKVYLFGGRSNQIKLSKKIQVFSLEQASWTVLKFKMHRGIENALVFSQRPNQLLIVGGATHFYNCKTVMKINLNQQTYQWDSKLNEEYRHTKGVKIGQDLFIFGGLKDSCQIFNKNSWKTGLFSHRKVVEADELEDFSFTQQSLVIKSSEVTSSKQLICLQEEQVFFGCDEYPCLIFYNKKNGKIKKSSVPMSLRLKKNIAVVQLPKKVYMLLGGSDKQQKKISRSCFFYYAYQNKAIQSLKMSEKKINFAAILHQNQVYVFGGYNPVQNVGYMNCQKFNLEQQKWIEIGALNKPNYKTFAEIIGDHKIAVFGNQDKNTPINEIQIYYIKRDYFDTFKLPTQIPNGVSMLYSVKQQNKIVILSQDECNRIQEIEISSQMLIQKELQKSAKRLNYKEENLVVHNKAEQQNEELNYVTYVRESKQKMSDYQSSQLHKNNMVAMKAKLVEIKPIKINSLEEQVQEEIEDSSFQVQKIVQYNQVIAEAHQQAYNKFKTSENQMPDNLNFQDDARFNLDFQSFESNLSTLRYKQSITQKKKNGEASSRKILENQVKLGQKQALKQFEGISKQKHKIIKRQDQIFFFSQNEVTVFNTSNQCKTTKKMQSQAELYLSHIA